jgi:hypothetical protein
MDKEMFLELNNINVLPLSVFEPNRTSLGETCRHVLQRQPPTQSLDQLGQALLHEWQRIPQVKIPNFIRSMPMRCRIVSWFCSSSLSGGWSTKHVYPFLLDPSVVSQRNTEEQSKHACTIQKKTQSHTITWVNLRWR